MRVKGTNDHLYCQADMSTLCHVDAEGSLTYSETDKHLETVYNTMGAYD